MFTILSVAVMAVFCDVEAREMDCMEENQLVAEARSDYSLLFFQPL